MSERKHFNLEMGPFSFKDGWFANDMFVCLSVFRLETEKTAFILQIIWKFIDDLQFSVTSL